MTNWTKNDLITLFWITVSALVYTFNLNVFIYSGAFFPGGFSGLSVLTVRILERYYDIHILYGLVYAILNIPFTILVFKQVGRKFTIFSAIHYVLVSIFTTIFPKIYVAYDPILIAIFGGLLAGVGSSIALLRNASAAGTDFIAIWLSNKLKRPVWNYIMFGNVVLLSLAGLLFGFEAALYSIIYQFVVTQVINDRHTRYKTKSLYIITTQADAVSQNILKSVRHGITIMEGEGAYSHTKRSILYMVINAYQVQSVVSAAQEIDPKVFITINNTERIIGNYYQKPLE